MTNCLNSGVHLTKNCRCANLVCLNEGVHPKGVWSNCDQSGNSVVRGQVAEKRQTVEVPGQSEWICRLAGNRLMEDQLPRDNGRNWAQKRRVFQQVARFGNSASLVHCANYSLAVFSSSLWRIYASVFCSDACCVRGLSFISTVRPGTGFVFFCRHCLRRS